MSPVSRGRKGRKGKKPARRPALPDVLGGPDECDCPACSGADFDPQRLIDELLAGAGDLIGSEDPLDVETAGAAFLAIGEVAGEAFEEALVGGFIPAFEAQAGREAVAMLLAIGSVAGDRVGKAASTAADRLVRAGILRPGWVAELDEPVTLTDGRRLIDADGTASMLICSFRRAGRSHNFVVSVDHLDCGAAHDILLYPGDQLATALEALKADGRDGGIEIRQEALDPAELRWHVENALDARAVHDSDERELETADVPVDDDDLPGYRALAVLLRARMSTLPAPGRPPAPHGADDHLGTALIAAQKLLAGNSGAPFSSSAPILPRGRTPAKLPAKRKRSDGAAPVYQIKVGLRGAKPPIWRRLEVPADISLARLHSVIQVAFAWCDSHLHVFDTPHGEFGVADAELGYRAEAPVTLEQVAPDARSKIRYTYDFGDDWEHDILVEKVLDRDETAGYPRCTGGRRAAPPEDCGGIWGYADLAEILADAAHPEHDDRLEWLGLDNATQFDPAEFDAAAVTRALSSLR
ncbi:MAG: plasmid pRiA4b ORF-3 family protein [Pseudonocardiaceae bacterium]